MNDDLETLRAHILTQHPELTRSNFTLINMGWSSAAVDVDDRLIFKFPRNEAAKAALLKEAALLSHVRKQVSLPVPDLFIYTSPTLFSRHQKIKGKYLLREDYNKLSESERTGLGERMGMFYAQLHRLDKTIMQKEGADTVLPWKTPSFIREKAIPALTAKFHEQARQIISAYENLSVDPYGTVYGFFDGHGWNMAFDHETGQLNGLYDFGDSAIGPLHQEFIYSNLVSSDLTGRIVSVYERLTGKRLDRERIAVLTGIHRLSELAQEVDNENRALMLHQAELWLEEEMARPQP